MLFQHDHTHSLMIDNTRDRILGSRRATVTKAGSKASTDLAARRANTDLGAETRKVAVLCCCTASKRFRLHRPWFSLGNGF